MTPSAVKAGKTSRAAAWAAAALLAAGMASGQGLAEWRVESSDAAGVVLLWEDHAGGREAGSGRGNGSGRWNGSAPRTAALGLPAGSHPTATVEVLAGYGTPGDPAAPGGAIAPPAPGTGFAPKLALSKPARYRDLEVSSIAWDPAAGGAPVRAARIRIRYGAGGAAGAVPSPAGGVEDRAGARNVFAPAPDSPAERQLRSWLVNYPQSRAFRSQPAAATAAARIGAAAKIGAAADRAVSASGPAAGASLPRIRLLVRTRGENIEVIGYDALRKAGVPVDRIDPRRMRLFRDGAEAPMHIAGGDDGRWHPGDYIEFIGRAPKGEKTRLSLYASTAAFILTWEGGQLGLRAPASPVAGAGDPLAASPAGIREAPPFNASVHLEEDVDVLRIGSTAEEEIVDLGERVQEAELTDFWMWERQKVDVDAAEIRFNLDLDPVGLGKGGAIKVAPLRIRVNLKGITNNPKADPDHHVKFLLNGKDVSLVDGVANDAVWEGQESFTWASRDLDASILKPGRNTLVLQKVNDLKANDGSPVEVQDAYLNWFELDFASGYRVREDRSLFSNSFADSLGARTFNLEGFTTADLSVWDLGGRKLTGYRVSRRDTAYTLSFTDSLAGPTRFLACALDRREVPELQLDTLPDLVSPAQGADWLVITHKELLGSALDSLVEHRRKQGLRTKVVQAGHIYQAFGDGSIDPAAIRRFVQHAYRDWPRPAPAYLLLVGEASLWFEKKSGALQRTLVPTHLVNIRGWGVAADDGYFAQVSGEDAIPDLMVGRIPVATREDLSRVVRKTLALESRRPAGHHDNQALLISGYEESFTAQNARLQALAVAGNRQYARVDLFPRSPHFLPESRRSEVFDRIDSGFTLVSFVGHGGGAVWSDAGVLTLSHLDAGRLRGPYPVPFVSSITCLTGYFEDWSARSLGEEMLRLDKGGAASFYGAAGYISSLAGEALSYEVLAAATAGATTAGAVVQRAETMVQLKTGGAFAPILSEFNLLGDPALRLPFPENPDSPDAPETAGAIDIDPRTLNGRTSMEVRGEGLSPANSQGVLTLFLGDSAISSSSVQLSGGSFALQKDLAGLAGPVPDGKAVDGKAVLHYWSGKDSRVAAASFSTLDWLIDSVSLEPADAAPGDSVRVSLRLATDYPDISVEGGIASYAVGGDEAPLFPGDQQIALRAASGNRLETSGRFLVPSPPANNALSRLHVAFRLAVRVLDGDGSPAGSIANLGSRTYSLPLSHLARLAFAEPPFRVPVQDSLGLWAVFRNAGLGAARGFSVVLTRDADSPSPAEDTAQYRGELSLGEVDSLFFPLPDSLLDGRRCRVSLLPGRSGELADRGTVRDTVFRILTRFLSGPSDTLRLDSAARLSLAAGGRRRRVFAEITAATALPTHLSPAAGDLPAELWRLESSAPEAEGLVLGSLAAQGEGATAGAGAAKLAGAKAAEAVERPFWHWRGAAGAGWVKLDTASPGYPWTARAWKPGDYGLFRNQDRSPPFIQFSSRGRALLQDDYVPRNSPIDVVVRDAEGVDLALHPPAFKSERQSPDSSTLAVEAGSATPTLVRLNFLPKHAFAEDVVEVVATDVSGNSTRKTLAYRQGEDLSIRNLGSYPNPFADTAVIAYSLTDYCDKVQLRIYSRAGRLVRSLEERDVVGYREVIWDGRAEGGGAIGNGLYFLKVTAHAGDRESSQVFKLFKKRRK